MAVFAHLLFFVDHVKKQRQGFHYRVGQPGFYNSVGKERWSISRGRCPGISELILAVSHPAFLVCRGELPESLIKLFSLFR